MHELSDKHILDLQSFDAFKEMKPIFNRAIGSRDDLDNKNNSLKFALNDAPLSKQIEKLKIKQQLEEEEKTVERANALRSNN